MEHLQGLMIEFTPNATADIYNPIHDPRWRNGRRIAISRGRRLSTCGGPGVF